MTMTNALSTANKYQMEHAKPVGRAGSEARAAPQERAEPALHVHMGNTRPSAAQHEAADTAPTTGLGNWVGLGVLALLFAASVVYVALGGVLVG
jgi:hypothetical protein